MGDQVHHHALVVVLLTVYNAHHHIVVVQVVQLVLVLIVEHVIHAIGHIVIYVHMIIWTVCNVHLAMAAMYVEAIMQIVGIVSILTVQIVAPIIKYVILVNLDILFQHKATVLTVV